MTLDDLYYSYPDEEIKKRHEARMITLEAANEYHILIEGRNQ
jgi:hypothetical protein